KRSNRLPLRDVGNELEQREVYCLYIPVAWYGMCPYLSHRRTRIRREESKYVWLFTARHREPFGSRGRNSGDPSLQHRIKGFDLAPEFGTRQFVEKTLCISCLEIH